VTQKTRIAGILGERGLVLPAFGPAGSCTIAGETFREGDMLSLDGHAGNVIAGEVQVEIERPEADLARLEQWRREP